VAEAEEVRVREVDEEVTEEVAEARRHPRLHYSPILVCRAMLALR
jgi:hypothetical protein